MLTTTSHRSRGRLVLASCLLAVAALAGPLGSGAQAAPKADAPICPAAPGNARFVRFIYLNILERCPDAAAAKYWTGKLDAGGLRWGFAESIDMSAENVGKNNVLPLYEGVLNRKPTDDEYKATFDEIRKTHQDARILARLFSSDEAYGMLSGTAAAKDTTFVTEAYKNIVDREPTAAELASGRKAIGVPSTEDGRHKLALALEQSDENMQGWTAAVIGAGVHRAPAASDFATWIPWLHAHDRQTFRMWTHVLSSNSAYKIAQQQQNPEPEGEH